MLNNLKRKSERRLSSLAPVNEAAKEMRDCGTNVESPRMTSGCESVVSGEGTAANLRNSSTLINSNLQNELEVNGSAYGHYIEKPVFIEQEKEPPKVVAVAVATTNTTPPPEPMVKIQSGHFEPPTDMQQTSRTLSPRMETERKGKSQYTKPRPRNKIHFTSEEKKKE